MIKVLLQKKFAPHILVTALLLLIYAILWRHHPERVGDGSEYYAMFYAWSNTFRPWMTDVSFTAFDQLFKQNVILGMIPVDVLKNAFPALRLGVTADFNHFWFYSFLAFISSKLLTFVGLSHTTHQSYLTLHFLLLLSMMLTAFHLYKWRGLFAIALMTFTSPMLWYFDKVHTELFTYCLVSLGVMFVYSRAYLFSALTFAVASTQNPSFALIAFIPFFYRIVPLRKEPFSFLEIMCSIGIVLFVLAHPVYYFLRFGVATPQLLAGGASLGGNLSTFYIWLIDPDVGLLPNWPFGVLLCLSAGVVYFFKKNEESKTDKNIFFYLFLLAFLLINFYAHSSTQNINSGATPGVARYALWYIPAFFPLTLYVIDAVLKSKLSKCGFAACALIIVVNFIVNKPFKHESYTKPSKLSSLIQSKASFMYDPPPEVFLERFSGLGEVSLRGVLGPDCKKMLIFPSNEKLNISIPAACFLDSVKFDTYIKSLKDKEQTNEPYYTRIPSEILEDISLKILPGEYQLGLDKNGNFILGSGWSNVESWGVWSDGEEARLELPCNASQFYANRSRLNVNLFLQSFGAQDIVISHTGVVLYQGKIDKPTNIPISLNVRECHTPLIDVRIRISDPKSPLELGMSSDGRSLGIALLGFSIQ